MRLLLRVVFISIVQVLAFTGQKPSLNRHAAIGWEGAFLHSRGGEAWTRAFHHQSLADATFTMSGLPTDTMIQEGADITEAQWPADFCVNVKIEAPDSSDYSDTDPVKAIALIGGAGEAGGGTGKCNYFLLFFLAGNEPGMGVQCDGGGSDLPLVAGQNLTSSTTYDLSFCYSGNTTGVRHATISIDGTEAASEDKNFVYPRQGKVTVLAGSHDSDVAVTEGVTLTSLTIEASTTTTTTTTTTTLDYAGTVQAAGANKQDHPFVLQNVPRTAAATRTATITSQEWPQDFCIDVVINTPATTTGVRCIALIGGNETCGNFEIYFNDTNRVGMGVSCDAGSSLETVAGVTAGIHTYQFCYAKIEGLASISVDGTQVTSDDDLDWDLPTNGSVSVLVGSHDNSTTEVLEGVSLDSLKFVTRNPLAPAPPPTEVAGTTEAVR